MTQVAREAYAPYPERMGGQRPAPMDEDYAAVVAGAEAWVAESDDSVVGFLVLIAEGEGMLLDNIAVLPSHQGQGVGRALLTLAEERARARGCGRIRLYTNQAMVENQRLYAGIGYTETHRTEDHGFSRVFYEKDLTRPG